MGKFVAVHVNKGHITSSPFFTPARIYARCNAAVPLLTATHSELLFKNFWNLISNSLTFGPSPIQRELRVSLTNSIAFYVRKA